MKRIYIVAAIIMLLTACASTHNLNSDGQNHLGGGYEVGNKNHGRIPITAKTNFAPWENYSGARAMWERLAEDACGHTNYKEEEVKEYSYETVPGILFIKYIVTVKEGYAVCS